MNFMDIVYILLLLAGLSLGFFNGTIKLAVSIIAFYVGIILASLYFQTVGNFFRTQFGSSQEVGQITAFATILLVAFLLLTIAGLYTFRYAHLPPSLDFVDRVIGTLLGLGLAALFMGMLSIILRDLFVFRNVAASLDFPFMIFLQNNIRSSFLVAFFGTELLPLIYGTLQPILPQEADIIFRV
ncbi:MAG: CvpA family protein [Blastochloris sp.]|nr:CvpA family protein [Blastochloris sp.]